MARQANTLIIVFSCVLIGVGAYFFTTFPKPGGGSSAGIELSPSFRQEIEAILAKNSAIVSSMPSHPKSKEVLDTVLAVIGFEYGKPSDETLTLAVEFFRDSNLGLFALREFLNEGSGEGTDDRKRGYARRLCDTYPGSRVSAMAFDYLLHQHPDKVAFCTEYRDAVPNTRLSIFALIKEGDAYHEMGDDARAVLRYLDAWQQDTDRAKAMHAKTMAILESHAQWRYSMILPAEEAASDATLPVISALKNAIQRFADETDPPAEKIWDSTESVESLQGMLANTSLDNWYRVEAGTRALKALVSAGRLDEAAQVTSGLLTLLRASQEEPDYILGVAAGMVLLSEGVAGANQSASPAGNSLKLLQARQEFLTAQEKVLDFWIEKSIDGEPSLRKLQARLLARSRLAKSDVRGAVALLESALKTADAGPGQAAEIVLELAQIYAEEWDSPARAGALCAEYGGSLAQGQHTRELRIQAGNYFFKAEDFDDALAQFSTLGQMSDREADKELGRYMVALCRLQQGEDTAAVSMLEDFASTYPESRFTPHALYLAASSELQAMRYGEARDKFDDLIYRFPDSEYTSRAKDYLSKLEQLKN